MGIGRPNLATEQESFAQTTDLVAREVFKFRLHMDILLKDKNEAQYIAGLALDTDRKPLKKALVACLRRLENGNFKGGHALLKGLPDDANEDGQQEPAPDVPPESSG